MIASQIKPGDEIYDVQINGERIERKTVAKVTHVWQHGPCITVLTARGYVEYSAGEVVKGWN